LGVKAHKVISQPSNSAKATELMRKYDKDFSLIELEKESTYIFRDVYNLYLENNSQALEILCGEQALGLLQSLIRIN
jgi:hypothetical protein